MKYQANLSKKYVTVLYCISNFAGAYYKKLLDTATSPFISWCFTSTKDFIHHYQKKYFWHEFPFFNGFTPTLKAHPSFVGKYAFLFLMIQPI